MTDRLGKLNRIPADSGNILVLIYFVVLLGICLLIYRDYGVSADEMTQRAIGQTSLSYLANLFNIPSLLGGAQPLADPASVFLAQRDRDYGVAFELPAEFLIKVLNIHDGDAYFFRHLLTFLFFYVAFSIYVGYLAVFIQMSSFLRGKS